jgi:DNA-binding NarL/FixJ family response regulator
MRLVVADEHVSVRQMLARYLGENENFEVVGEARSGLEAIRLCERRRPDVAIIDLPLPEMSGVEVLRRLRSELPATRSLVYSGISDPTLASAALRAQPHGYVQKQDPLEVLRDGIRAVVGGGCYYCGFAAALLRAPDDGETLLAGLGATERAMLQMVAEGWRTKEIADKLALSNKSAERHRQNMMRKLGRRDVAALTRFAVRMGLVEAG